MSYWFWSRMKCGRVTYLWPVTFRPSCPKLTRSRRSFFARKSMIWKVIAEHEANGWGWRFVEPVSVRCAAEKIKIYLPEYKIFINLCLSLCYQCRQIRLVCDLGAFISHVVPLFKDLLWMFTSTFLLCFVFALNIRSPVNTIWGNSGEHQNLKSIKVCESIIFLHSLFSSSLSFAII